MFLGYEVLQPPILHFQLGDAGFQRSVSLSGFSDGSFQCLFALFLLHAEACAGRRISTPTVFFCCAACLLLLTQGGGDAIPGDGGTILGVSDLAIRGGDGRGHVRRSESSRRMADFIGGIRNRRIQRVSGIWEHLICQGLFSSMIRESVVVCSGESAHLETLDQTARWRGRQDRGT